MNRRTWISSTAILGTTAIMCPNTLLLASVENGDFDNNQKIYLGANENPYGPSKRALAAMGEYLNRGNRYPVELRQELKRKIGNKYNLSEDHVVLGAGSSEILQLIANWCLHEKLQVITGTITFSVIPEFVKKFGGKVVLTEMTSGKAFDLEALASICKKKPGLVYLVNPNNPTGTKLNKTDLIHFCNTVTEKSYLVIDEAYIEYIGENESCIDLIHSNPKIIIVRTFSKMYGLAGMRIGYCLAQPQIAKLIRSHQIWPSINLNMLGLAAADVCLDDKKFVLESKKANERVRNYVQSELKNLGLDSIESFANFIYYKCNPTKKDIVKHFSENNIVVGIDSFKGEKWMRLTLGTMSEMEQFIQAAKILWG